MIALREIPSDHHPSSQAAALKGDTTFQRFIQIHKRGLIPWAVFLLMALVFVVRTAVLHHHEQQREPSSVLSKGVEHFLKSREEANPLWSYSTLYDEDDDRLQECDAAFSVLYERHAKFIWIEVGVILFAPHLSMHKLFRSPTMRAVLRQQTRVLKRQTRVLSSTSRRMGTAIGKTIKNLYKNRSRYSSLSEYTWYFTIEEEDQKSSTPKFIDLVVDKL